MNQYQGYLLCFLYGLGRNYFDAGKIHYKGHWQGRALKIETFLGPEMATLTALSTEQFRNQQRHIKCLIYASGT